MIEVDGAKLYFKKRDKTHPDRWVVTLETINVDDKPCNYRQIVVAHSKSEAIEYLETQIKILQSLLDSYRG